MQPDINYSLKKYIEKMPALPTSVGKIMEICNDPTTSPADLSKVISLDPVLMGRVMKLINSAYYGLSNQVTSLVRAIIMLGFNTVKNLTLSTAVLGTVGLAHSQALNMEGFWMHSLSVGVTTKLIAKKRGESSKDLEEFFVSGLLHDIGKIAFNNIVPNDYTITLSYAKNESIPLLEGENRMLSSNHLEAGKMIASNWKLGDNLTDAISHHHGKYEGPHKTQVYAVCAANYFANIMEIGFSGDSCPEALELEVFDHLRVNLDDLKGMEDEIREAIEKARIFLQLAR